MATLGGDLIRMLAHGGISTLGNVGAQLLSNYLKPGMEVRESAGKALLGTLGTGSEEEANAAARALESDYGVKWPTATRTNPAGVEVVSPEGAKLTAPRASLNDLAPGVTPQMGLVRPAPTLESIKSKILTGLTPEEQKTAAFPKDATLQAARENLIATMALKEQEGALNRASREDISKDRLTMQQMIAGIQQSGQEQARMQTQQWRDFLKQNYTEKMSLLKDVNERRQLEGELGKLTALEGKITGAKKPDEKKMFMSQANELIKNSVALKGYPMWEEDVTVPGTGILGSDWFGTKEKVPVGQKPSAAPKAAATALVPLTFPRRVLVKGTETIVNSQDEYDALKRGLGK